MSQIMEKFDVLNELNDEFKQRVKILYVFKDYENELNVLIVTKDDKTFGFGQNSQLGFELNEIQIVEELCDQQIIDFANGFSNCIARNSSGKIYCWGWNQWGEVGIGSKDESSPKLNLKYLNNEFVIDITCGARHSLVLTDCGEVYAWGENYSGQIGNSCNNNQLKPIKVKGFNNERVVMISCGSYHSMALTECGHVFSWGYNGFGQLGVGNTVDSNEPKFVAIIDENKYNVFIEKISCGSNHSLLLSSDGNIYAFGRNNYGELGNQKEENELSPHRIKIETKFIDISSLWFYDKGLFSGISTALSQEEIYYNWGKCGEEIIRSPKPTNFESFVEIYAKYFKITHKAINFEDQKSISLENKFVKVKGNKTEHNSVNRFNSQPNEIANSQLDFKELIGEGSFGKVYKAINRLDNKQYAVKKINLKGKCKSIFSIRVRVNVNFSGS
jgi:RCC1 and BTB domain-containing protein